MGADRRGVGGIAYWTDRRVWGARAGPDLPTAGLHPRRQPHGRHCGRRFSLCASDVDSGGCASGVGISGSLFSSGDVGCFLRAGYEILNARDLLAYDEMLAVILVIGLLGITLDVLASRLLRQRRGRR